MERAMDYFNTKGARYLAEIVNQEDNWAGITDPVARRKLQNKLNQRARRRRQAPDKATPLRSKIADVQQGHQIAQLPSYRLPMSVREWTTQSRNISPLEKDVYITIPRRNDKDFTFPLSVDHLIHLVQFNVYRALLINMHILGTKRIFDCNTNLEEEDSKIICLRPLPTKVPLQLEPTALQLCTRHFPWIDLFPLPALRDLFIRKQDTFDSCELYIDILGSIGNKTLKKGGLPYASRQYFWPTNHRTGVVVWDDPWSVDSWEMEDGFIQKWGWLIRDGCQELLLSTNKWRALRGEDLIGW